MTEPNRSVLSQSRRRTKKATLLKRDGNVCRWCREPFIENDPPTLEHIVPRRFGGSNKNENLCLAHRLCNV